MYSALRQSRMAYCPGVECYIWWEGQVYVGACPWSGSWQLGLYLVSAFSRFVSQLRVIPHVETEGHVCAQCIYVMQLFDYACVWSLYMYLLIKTKGIVYDAD